MLDYSYVLAAHWADQSEVLDHGTLTGSDPVELTRQQLRLCKHPDSGKDVFGEVRGSVSDNDTTTWRFGAVDPDAPLVSAVTTRGGPFGTGSTEVQIPCRTVHLNQPDTAAPEVSLIATFVPFSTGEPKPPPTTRLGALLRQFGMNIGRL